MQAMRWDETHWPALCHGCDALLHLCELGDESLGSARVDVRDFHLVRLAHFSRLSRVIV